MKPQGKSLAETILSRKLTGRDWYVTKSVWSQLQLYKTCYLDVPRVYWDENLQKFVVSKEHLRVVKSYEV